MIIILIMAAPPPTHATSSTTIPAGPDSDLELAARGSRHRQISSIMTMCLIIYYRVNWATIILYISRPVDSMASADVNKWIDTRWEKGGITV